MIDPRRCSSCKADVENSHRVHIVAIDAETLRHRTDERLCPGCAARVLKTRRFGPPDVWALEAAAEILDLHFGEPVRVKWLNGDHRHWLVMCRRRYRLRESPGGTAETQICAANPDRVH